jgi:hypothetical protein
MSVIARLACGAALAAAVLVVWPARAADETGIDAKTAFEKLKTLAGEWKADGAGEHGDGAGKVIFRVTSNGSTLMQTQFPGSDHEMVSMYHVDGSDLLLTHYCALGNQPRLKLDKKASSANELKFVFDGGTNLDASKDMHIHGLRTVFKDKGHVEEEWDAFQAGKKSATQKFSMSRP